MASRVALRGPRASRFLRASLFVLVGLAVLLPLGASLGRVAFLVHPPEMAAPPPVGLPAGRAPSPSERTDAAFLTHRGLGLLHVVPGMLMLVLGPFQVSRRLRGRLPRAHRWLGRAFVLAAVVAALSGLVINFVFPPTGGPLQVAVLSTAGLALLVTVSMGWGAIVRRQVAAHRRWMIRAWGVALASGVTSIVAVPVYLVSGELGESFIGVSRLLGLVLAAGAAELAAQGAVGPTAG